MTAIIPTLAARGIFVRLTPPPERILQSTGPTGPVLPAPDREFIRDHREAIIAELDEWLYISAHLDLHPVHESLSPGPSLWVGSPQFGSTSPRLFYRLGSDVLVHLWRSVERLESAWRAAQGRGGGGSAIPEPEPEIGAPPKPKPIDPAQIAEGARVLTEARGWLLPRLMPPERTALAAALTNPRSPGKLPPPPCSPAATTRLDGIARVKADCLGSWVKSWRQVDSEAQ